MQIIGKTGAFLENPAVCFLGRAIRLWNIISKSSEAADPKLNPQRKAGKGNKPKGDCPRNVSFQKWSKKISMLKFSPLTP